MELIQQYGQWIFIVCAVLTAVVYTAVRTFEINRVAFIALHLVIAYPATGFGGIAAISLMTKGTGSILMSVLVLAFVVADVRFSKPKTVLSEISSVWKNAGKTKMAV